MSGSDKTTIDMLGRTGIVPLSEALQLMRRHLPAAVPDEESAALEEALGRVSSRELRSPENLPAHPRATMDGFAVRAADTFGASERLPAYFEIGGEVRMGELPAAGISGPGKCFSIATGGYLPPGTDAIVKLEQTIRVDEQTIEVVSPVAGGGNVMAAGEDIREGEVLVNRGHRLRPQDLGLLAGVGIKMVFVFRSVRVGIISTGDEIVPFAETPGAGKIRDINAVSLSALVRGSNAVPTHYGIVRDEEADLRTVICRALAENDLVVFSGSSSVGARDMGERVIEALGPPGIIVHGVMVKPGKPVILAVVLGKPVFGLPGHPVSAVVSFDLFVRPALQLLAGLAGSALPAWRTVSARIMRNVNSSSGRTDFVRVQVQASADDKQVCAYPVLGKSGALSTMVRADGYVVIEDDRQGLQEGENVVVRLFD